MKEEQFSSWIERQSELVMRLESLLVQQASDHEHYAHESSERMSRLNEVMHAYIDMQRNTLEQYITQIDKLSNARASAQENVAKLLEALHEEQTKNKVLLEIIRNLTSSPSASVNVNAIKP